MEQRATIAIAGMSCGHCVGAVKSALQGIDGVRVEEVKVGAATIAYDPESIAPARIAQAIEQEGFTVTGTQPQR